MAGPKTTALIHPSRLTGWLKRNLSGWSWAVIIFFIALLAAGLAIYRDYGMGWDEQAQYLVGLINYRYIFGINQNLLTFIDRYYGPVFELFLYALTGNLPTYQMYYARHLLNFLTFAAGIYVFYLLIRRLWQKTWLALVGCLALVLSPRIFADAFYNSKDIPFMVGFILAVYTLVRYLDQRSWKNLFIHLLTSSVLIAIRIPGVFIAVLTAGFAILDLFLNRQWSWGQRSQVLTHLAVFIGMGFGLVVLFWPILWYDPLGEIGNAFQKMSSFPKETSMFFKGFVINSRELPLTYVPTWIAITTPFLYLASFAAGLVNSAVAFFSKPYFSANRDKRNLVILLAWFFIPILTVIVMRSTLYDGWRQMYFVYPALILIGLYGLSGTINLISRFPRPKFGHLFLAALVLAGMVDPISFTVRNHPYEYIYFNRLAGDSLADIKYQYDMDYWGISAKQALDYILQTDPASTIVVIGDGDPAFINSHLLPPDQANRLQFTDDIAKASYMITNYRNHPQDFPYPDEVFNLTIDGAKLVSVFRLK